MAKRRTIRAKIASRILFCCLDGMKGVADRFDGLATELGREDLPRNQQQQYLKTMESLLEDFPVRFPLELFSPRGMPAEWTHVGDVAKSCQAELAQRHSDLVRLKSTHSDTAFKTRFQAASAALLPLAKKLTDALKAT